MMPPQLKDPFLAYVAGKQEATNRVQALTVALNKPFAAPTFTAKERADAFYTGVFLGKKEQEAAGSAGFFAVETPKGTELIVGAGDTQLTVGDIRRDELKEAMLDDKGEVNPFKLISLLRVEGSMTVGPSVLLKDVKDLSKPFASESEFQKRVRPMIGTKTKLKDTVVPIKSKTIPSNIAVTRLGPDTITKGVGSAIESGLFREKELRSRGMPPLPQPFKFVDTPKVSDDMEGFVMDDYEDAIKAATKKDDLYTNLRDALKLAEAAKAKGAPIPASVQKNIITLGQEETLAAYSLATTAGVPFKFKPTFKQIGDYIVKSVTGRPIEEYGIQVNPKGTFEKIP